ncbi:MAG: hypothetical protein IJ776_02350 [Paludibacteraceae bacterium]|nr:hypothetical protein [Paludibacteraceae bacterium]
MNAKQIFAVAVMALAVLAMPVEAQSRKDKKTAQKEQWEMQQRQQKEEAELRHKLRMDSIANAQKVAEEKAAKAEAERRQQEAEAKAKQKKAEEAAALQEVDFNEPCMDFESTADLIRARGIGEDFEQQLSVEMARSAAIEELGSQISTKMQALLMNYKKSKRQNLKRESLRRVEGLTMTEVNQSTGYRIACRKTVTYVQNGERIFKTYMVVELGADQLLKPIYDGIQKDNELKIDGDYQSFKKEFDDHFKNQSAEALQEILNE